MKIKPKRLKWRVLPCALLFVLWPLSSLQAEVMYSISETELTALETNLQTLKSHNQERQKALTEQAALLNQQQSEIEKLQTEIKASKAANEETRKSLEKANKYLSELEQEQKNKLRVKTRQRNLWIAISAGLMYAWIRK